MSASWRLLSKLVMDAIIPEGFLNLARRRRIAMPPATSRLKHPLERQGKGSMFCQALCNLLPLGPERYANIDGLMCLVGQASLCQTPGNSGGKKAA